MLFAHLKRILRLDRLRLRGPSGAQFEFTLAATQEIENMRTLERMTDSSNVVTLSKYWVIYGSPRNPGDRPFVYLPKATAKVAADTLRMAQSYWAPLTTSSRSMRSARPSTTLYSTENMTWVFNFTESESRGVSSCRISLRFTSAWGLR
jgi:hypothetical protein